MWCCRHGLTHRQKAATHNKRRATMWSLQAWAVGKHFASHRAQCRQGLEVQLTICFCRSLLGPVARPSDSSVFSYSISFGYSSVLPFFLKYVSKGFCFSECFCLQEEQGTIALSAYPPKNQLQTVCSSSPAYGAKLMLNYLFLIPFH